MATAEISIEVPPQSALPACAGRMCLRRQLAYNFAATSAQLAEDGGGICSAYDCDHAVDEVSGGYVYSAAGNCRQGNETLEIDWSS